MTLSEKIKTVDNKIEQRKAQYNLHSQTAKISTLLTGGDVLPGKGLSEKTATIKKFVDSALDGEFKKKTNIPKDQFKLLKDPMNDINNNREDGIKTEDGVKAEDSETIDTAHHNYIGNECQDLINNTLTSGLKNKDLYLTNFGNRITTFLQEKNIDVFEDCV